MLRHDAPSEEPAADRTRAWARLSRGLVLALPALVVLVGGWMHRWTNEDAFINFRIVDQIVAGHGPVFNTGERVEAFTSPLWLGALVVIRVTLGRVLSVQWATLLVCLVMATAGYAIGARATRKLHPDGEWVIPIGLLTIAAIPVVWDFATSGLEIALVWLWLAGCWSVLVDAAQGEPALGGRHRLWPLLVLGLGPVVRPDLGLMSVCFVAAWLYLARPPLRRMVADVLVAFSVSIAYQVFRMGYYASLIPTTALAKDAGGVHLRQGIHYAADLSRPYALWIPLLLVIGLIAQTMARNAMRTRVAIATMCGAGLLHAAYMIVIGGDYMHGRLLLPALFALVLPAAVVWSPRFDVRRAAMAGAVVVVASVWAVTCAGWLRYQNQRSYLLTQISSWRDLAPRPLVEPREIQTPFLTGTQVAQAYARGQRGTVKLLGDQIIRSGDPHKLVVVFGSIGIAGYKAGIDVRVVDLGGLAEPLAARSEPVPGRPAGHRKETDLNWYTAQFGVPADQPDAAKVAAARRALRCAPLSTLLGAIDKPLTPSRFLSNVVRSFSFTNLQIPRDPQVAEREFCGAKSG